MTSHARSLPAALVLAAVCGTALAEPAVEVNLDVIGGPAPRSPAMSAPLSGGTVQQAPVTAPVSRLHVPPPRGSRAAAAPSRPANAPPVAFSSALPAPPAAQPVKAAAAPSKTVAASEPKAPEAVPKQPAETAPEPAAEATPPAKPATAAAPPPAKSTTAQPEPAAAPPPPPELKAAEMPPPEPSEETVASADANATAAASAAAGDALPPPGVVALPFAEDETTLQPDAKAELDTVATALKADDSLRVQVLAYASGPDLTASRARRLSLSRALAVRSQLMQGGIDTRRIDVRALGDKATGEPKNRVDVKVVPR